MLLLSLFIAISCYSQSILIDSTFYSDSEIYPFTGIDSITGLKISGSVSLKSDSSLVRVILSNGSGLEYMVFEAYPLIATENDFSFSQQCEETCYLDFLGPYSLSIQIIDATLTIDTLQVLTNGTGNLDSLQYIYKRANDALKIEMINLNAPRFNLEYMAGDNPTVADYYYDKKIIYGEKYNLGGYDYYMKGIFSFPWSGEKDYCRGNIVKTFDWRSRHRANQLGSQYYDFDTTGTGWMTKAKSQDSCGACFIFAPIGVLEADINLYFNQHLDFDLSEQNVICYEGDSTCTHGGNPSTVFQFFRDYGVRTEDCFPYRSTDNEDTCIRLYSGCMSPDTVVKIYNYDFIHTSDSTEIITSLIQYGPLSVTFTPQKGVPHEVTLTGYIIDPFDSSIVWIYKDSKGSNMGEHGFYYAKIHLIVPRIYVKDSITVDCDSPPSRRCLDLDGDGYYNWGIGNKPDTLQVNPDEEDCDDSDPNLGPYDPETYYCKCNLEYSVDPIHITEDTTWSERVNTYRDIIIDSTATLTVTDTILFAPQTKLIVMPGAKLIVDGGILTKACMQYWQGVEVWGMPDETQFYPAAQGWVIFSNGASVQYAVTGITTGKKQDTIYIPGYEGGIILGNNALFLNNKTCIEFHPYQNLNPGNPEQEFDNYSTFTKCTFETDYLAFFDEGLPVAQVSLEGAKGVRFHGCSFRYIYPENISDIRINNEKNIGIYANDADVYVIPEYEYPDPMPDPCDECYTVIPCTFENLRYGIKAFNGGNNRRFYVNNAVFNNVNAGIYLSGYQQPTIISSTFFLSLNHIGSFHDWPFAGGIYLEDCSGYHVEGNSFTGNYHPGPLSFSYWIIGIYILNSGIEDNEIYRNYFSHLHGGIVAVGENRGEGTGLCLKCNSVNTNLNDYLVWESGFQPGRVDEGIKEMQGSDEEIITAPAGNIFTNYDTLIAHDEGYHKKSYFNYFNSALPFTYIHHQRQEYPLDYPRDSNYTSQTISLQQKINLLYDSALACPSTIDNNNFKNGYDPHQEMNFAQGSISQYRNLLNLLVDGGNTEELNFDVMTSMPDDALGIRQQLIDDSPYLSDTVMKQAIYKEDVLPNAMIRDVLTANPQSAKSQGVLQSLDNRFNPMPDYMMAEIMQGSNYMGAKEILESKLGYWQQIRTNAKNQLIRKFISDTTILNPYDSLIALYESETDIPSKYRLAFCYFNNDQVDEALGTLNEIPLTFTLDDYQTVIHQDYENYFSILKMMHDSTWGATQLDSLSVNTLHSIMDDEYPLIGGYARGLLMKGHFINYVEKVYFPPDAKSYQAYHLTSKKPEATKKDHLRIFPNPSWDYVIVYYNTTDSKVSGKLIMNDINGKLINTIILPDQLNQMTISLKNLPKGIYIISLFASGKLIESQKINKSGNK